jgi:hypothetical protein
MTCRWLIVPFSLMLTCCGALEFSDVPDEGPICEQLDAGEWELDISLAGGDFSPKFHDDPVLEEYLLSYGMAAGGGWDRFMGNDFEYVEFTWGGEPELLPFAVSPYARALVSFETIATSFNGWQDFDPRHDLNDFEYHDNALKWFAAYIHQGTAAVHMDCGYLSKTATAERRGPRGWRITYFGRYFGLKDYERAAISLHEVVHVRGSKHRCGNSDCSWGWNAYSVEALWLVALANEYNDGTDLQQRILDRANKRLTTKIANGTTWTAEALLATLRLHGVEHFIRVAPTYEP